jgi:hypothetical protein
MLEVITVIGELCQSQSWTLYRLIIDYFSTGASFTKLTCVSDITFGNFLLWNTYNFVQQCNSLFLLNAKPESQWQILNQNISQIFSLSVLFLDLKFCKNLGFSLSDHCEWGTRTWLLFKEEATARTVLLSAST